MTEEAALLVTGSALKNLIPQFCRDLTVHIVNFDHSLGVQMQLADQFTVFETFVVDKGPRGEENFGTRVAGKQVAVGEVKVAV